MSDNLVSIPRAKVIEIDADKLFGVVEFPWSQNGIKFAAFRKGVPDLARIAEQLEVGTAVSVIAMIKGANIGVVTKIDLAD